MTTADTVYLTSVCVIIVIIYKCFLWRYCFVLQENGKSCENQLKGGVPSKFERLEFSWRVPIENNGQCISMRTPNLITTSIQITFYSYLFWVLVHYYWRRIFISICTGAIAHDIRTTFLNM